ncbi:hypothetical protein K7432_011730 [Basidiobolus ranarum]|uniref:F-box domain-containing protein n=1 Tax=Basidiobolus ranarum TaxID=34480 RepID=A0ABR2WLW3_9FUNG
MPLLPTDVLRQIFEYLSDEDEYFTLHSCTLVCHLWHPIANRALWRKPIVEQGGEYSSKIHNLILASPTHAHWIQDWSSRILPPFILLQLTKLRSLPEVPARILQPLVGNGIQTDIRAIRKLSSRGSELTLLAGILNSCPHLEQVVFRIFAIDGEENTGHLKGLVSMTHLVQLTIEFEDFDVGNFGATFIDSVTKLTPNLKHISLKTGAFIGHRLVGISERCPLLHSLSFEYWHDPEVEMMPIFIQELARGLGHRLRHFSVIQRGGYGSSGMYQAVWPLMDSLKTLHIWGVGLNEESFKALATGLSHSLSRLTFYRAPSSDGSDMTNIISTTAWENLFAECASSLVELNLLAFRPFPPTVSRVISEQYTNLKSLSITSEGADFVCPILRTCGPQLTNLELMGCSLGVETLNTVFEYCHSLTKLIFMHPEIGGNPPMVRQQGISKFLQKTGSRLQSLVITGTLISNRVLDLIHVHCKILKHLDLAQVMLIDEKAAVSDFKATLKDLKWIKINGKSIHHGIKLTA